MAVKKREKGKVLAEVGNYRIRQIPKYEGYGKKRKLISTSIAVFIAKKQLQGGFKTVLEAIEYATVLAKIDNEKK